MSEQVNVRREPYFQPTPGSTSTNQGVKPMEVDELQYEDEKWNEEYEVHGDGELNYMGPKGKG